MKKSISAPTPVTRLVVRLRSGDRELIETVAKRLIMEYGGDEAASSTMENGGEVAERWLAFAPPAPPSRLPLAERHAARLEQLYLDDAGEPRIAINFGYAIPSQLVLAARSAGANRIWLTDDVWGESHAIDPSGTKPPAFAPDADLLKFLRQIGAQAGPRRAK